MLKSLLVGVLNASAFIVAVSYLVLQVPDVHSAYLRNIVGSKVVLLRAPSGQGGLTGFHVKKENGETVLLTNQHGCALGRDEGYLNVDLDGILVPRSIMKESVWTDLCILEPLPGVEGIDLADDVTVGTTSYVLGHPKLNPLTVAKGELTGSDWIDVFDHVMDEKDPKDKCDLPKNRKVWESFFFFEQLVCLIHVEAYISNVPIRPGNSGSPLVDWTGALIGVAFAAGPDGDGYFIPLWEVKAFLESN